MHPRTFLDGFWRNDLADEIFVAMSFADKYNERWSSIIKPAIEDEPIAGRRLKAIRTDIRQSGDSILTEIIDGVAHAQMVVADISVTDTWEQAGVRHSYRNSNVLYEVGLAFACRQPVEVLLFRDDAESLIFDLSHIPVLTIDGSNAAASAARLRSALNDRFRERQLVKDLRVQTTLESLTQFDINLIRSNAHLAQLGWTSGSLPAAVAMSLPRLLELKVLRLVNIRPTDQVAIYEWSTFGREVAKRVAP